MNTATYTVTLIDTDTSDTIKTLSFDSISKLDLTQSANSLMQYAVTHLASATHTMHLAKAAGTQATALIISLTQSATLVN